MIDPLFDIHAAALQFHRQRMELIASNMANADTPGYQAKDLDFNKVLAQVEKTAAASTTAAAATTEPGHIALTGNDLNAATLKSATVFRVATQPSADGNTVDTQTEQAAYADAALHYQSSLSFIDYRLKSLMTAITGN